MENGKRSKSRFVPKWLSRADPEIIEYVFAILDGFHAISRLSATNSDGDRADLEGARDDFKNTLFNIFKGNGGNPDENPLWTSVMIVRPQVIGKYQYTAITEEISRALWALRDETEEKQPEWAEFFAKLGGRLRKGQIDAYRAFISGGELTIKGKDGKWTTHFFPGIPMLIRSKAGVRLTTARENFEPVLRAYEMMSALAIGHAKVAIEANIADIKSLLPDLNYPPNPVKKI